MCLLYDKNFAAVDIELCSVRNHVLESASSLFSFHLHTVLIIVVYIPPKTHSQSIKDLRQLLEAAVKRNDINSIVICGDLNYSKVEWKFDDENELYLTPRYRARSENSEEFVKLCTEFSLTQLNHRPNNEGNFLDLFRTDNPDLFETSIDDIIVPLPVITTFRVSLPSITLQHTTQGKHVFIK